MPQINACACPCQKYLTNKKENDSPVPKCPRIVLGLCYVVAIVTCPGSLCPLPCPPQQHHFYNNHANLNDKISATTTTLTKWQHFFTQKHDHTDDIAGMITSLPRFNSLLHLDISLQYTGMAAPMIPSLGPSSLLCLTSTFWCNTQRLGASMSY